MLSAAVMIGTLRTILLFKCSIMLKTNMIVGELSDALKMQKSERMYVKISSVEFFI